MNLHSTNNIVRKKGKTGICHVMQGQESNTCPYDSLMPQAQLYGCVAPKELFGCKLKRIIYK